jgi:hypothetical protein
MRMQTLSELQLYINLLEQTKGIKYSDYNKLIEDLKYEFNVLTTIDELNRIYEPTIDEEILDASLLLKNIFSW